MARGEWCSGRRTARSQCDGGVRDGKVFLHQSHQSAFAEGFFHVVVAVYPLAGQGYEQSCGNDLARINSRLADDQWGVGRSDSAKGFD